MLTNTQTLSEQGREFAVKLQEARTGDVRWYHSDSLANVARLEELLEGRKLDRLVDGKPVVDIGGADGDLAFFMESLGYEAHLIDKSGANYNELEGARVLKDALGSSVGIHDVDLDTQFRLPGEDYGLTLFLGILYHLKNPYYALQALSYRTRHLFLSTRVARFGPDGTRIEHLPLAYLLAGQECNGDATNFWIFTPAGLKRILHRTRWHVISEVTRGPEDSEPAALDKDQRCYMLLRSRRV